MKDVTLKKILSFVVLNKDKLYSLISNFKAEDLEKGIISIPSKLINSDYKMLIMEKTSPYLNDYYISFDRGYIFLDLDINAKQLGRLKAKYMLSIDAFKFDGDKKEIHISYKEDVKAEGNFMQNMAIKAAGLKGNYIQTALEFAKQDYIFADKESISINLSKIKNIDKVPENLILQYIGADNKNIKFHFSMK